jgi:hypothetical protein
MVSADVPEGKLDRCPMPSFGMAQAMEGNTFGSLLALQQAHNAASHAPGPLDYVSPADYTRWWRLRGARTGRIVKGEIVWDASSTPAIGTTAKVEQTEMAL